MFDRKFVEQIQQFVPAVRMEAQRHLAAGPVDGREHRQTIVTFQNELDEGDTFRGDPGREQGEAGA